jgi:hypothetical protein
MEKPTEIMYVKLTKTQRKAVEQLAQERECGLSSVIRSAVNAYFERRQQATTLVDSAETYTTTLPPALDKVHQGERKRSQLAPGDE